MRDDLTLDLGSALRPSVLQRFARRTSRRASASAGTRAAIRRRVDSRRLRLVLHAAALEPGRQLRAERPDGFGSYTAGSGPDRLSDLSDVRARGVRSRTRRPRRCRRETSPSGRARRAFYTQQFARYGVDFSKVPNYPDAFVNPRSQVASIGFEREVMKGFFVAADYVHQHSTISIARSISTRRRRSIAPRRPGALDGAARTRRGRSCRSTAAFRQINVIMNLGDADYDALQTMFSYRGNRRCRARSATRCRRRRTPPSRTATASGRTTRTSPARRAGARPEPARSAAPRGGHGQLQPAVSTSPPAP